MLYIISIQSLQFCKLFNVMKALIIIISIHFPHTNLTFHNNLANKKNYHDITLTFTKNNLLQSIASVHNKSFPRWSKLTTSSQKKIQYTIAPFVETIGAQATRCKFPNRGRPSTTRTRTQAQNRLCIRRASRDDCSVPGVALNASPSILEPRKWGSNLSKDFTFRAAKSSTTRIECERMDVEFATKKKKKKQSSFFGVLTLFRQLRCYNGRDVFKNKKKKDIFAQASRRSRLNISKKKKEGRKNEGFGVRDRKKEILARINCRGNGEDWKWKKKFREGFIKDNNTYIRDYVSIFTYVYHKRNGC